MKLPMVEMAFIKIKKVIKMAKACMHLRCNDIWVRTCGGNTSYIRNLTKWYNSLTPEEFLRKHPSLASNIKEYGFNVVATWNKNYGNSSR